MVFRMIENEFIFVPKEHYIVYKYGGKIEREMKSDEDIIFNLYNSPYNFRVSE